MLDKSVPDRFSFDGVGCPGMAELSDTKNDVLFRRTLMRQGREGDSAILISSSGNSLNILDASKICRERGIGSCSFSANGRLVTEPEFIPTHSVIIPLSDQQKLEEVSLAALLVLTHQIGLQLNGKSEDIQTTVDRYIEEYLEGVDRSINARVLLAVVEDIVSAFENRRVVRVDSTVAAGVDQAQHIAHNLRWDARDCSTNIQSTLILSGLLAPDITGKTNDGADGYALAMEVLENCRPGDVQILFTTTRNECRTGRIIQAAREREISLHIFEFGENELLVPALAEFAGHLLGRLTNTRVLVGEGKVDSSKAGEWMRTHDLALLRKKDETRARLERRFAR
jgi:phosphoheptose isomerase